MYIVSSGVIEGNWTWRCGLIARCLNGCTILYCFMYSYAATNRSTFEIKKGIFSYKYLRSLKLSDDQSVYFCEYLRHFSCPVTLKFYSVFQDIHIVQQIFATRLGVSCLGCVLPWRRRVLIPYSPGNIKTFWRYFDQNGLHSYSPVFNKATRGLAFGRILHIYCCHSDAK